MDRIDLQLDQIVHPHAKTFLNYWIFSIFENLSFLSQDRFLLIS